MKDRIKQIIDSLKPDIALHGGNIEFVDYDEKKNLVYVRLEGACHGCPFSSITLKNGILESIKLEMSEVSDIVVVP